MRRLIWILLLALPLLAQAATSHVILVQNSGWMEPFYSDPNSPFKPLVRELANTIVQPGDALLLASFNQSLPQAPSPRAMLSLRADALTGEQVGRSLAALDVARKPGGALADTDLGEALRAALALKPGLIWLITNNRNSPNNDQATARRNREFYELIHGGSAIHMALAWPLRMPVQGTIYRANGLMVYVFAVGDEGAHQLQSLMQTGHLQSLITEAPARLKPLDRDTVRLLPLRVTEAPGVHFASEGRKLVADIDPGTRTPQARIGWRLENTIYPYTIRQAHLRVRSSLSGEAHMLQLQDDQLRGLAPGQGRELASVFDLPVDDMDSPWSIEGVEKSGSAQILPGALELTLEDQQLELAPAFRRRMAELFPGDPMPEVFTPPRDIRASRVQLPLEVRVHFGFASLMALAGGIGGSLLLGAAAAHFALRPRRVRLTVNGEPRELRARVGSVHSIYDQRGEQVATLHTRLTGPRLLDVRDGAHIVLGA